MTSENIAKSDLNEPFESRWRTAFKILLSLLILAAGIAGAVYLKNTGPKAPLKTPEKRVQLVQAIAVHRTSQRAAVPAMGTVIPSQELVLKSRVSGQIIAVHPEFVDGGLIRKGETILQIDPADYALIVAQKESSVTEARYELQLELGRQDVAQREWEMLNGNAAADPMDEALALRKPHLEKAQADLAAAEAELEKARLDLERTQITAPFDVVVQSRNVEIGSQANAGEALATLAGTRAYWIQASIPVNRLKWIQVPQKTDQPGSPAKVVYSGGHERRGTVIRLLSDLQTEGRLARLLIEVLDPLNIESRSLKAPPLLIGEYVRVEIQGHELADVFAIPRFALRDGSSIWVFNKNARLEIRSVAPVWSDGETVFLNEGLFDGEQLIVSDLAAPVADMELRTEKTDASALAQSGETKDDQQP